MVRRASDRAGEMIITAPFHRKPAAVRLAYPQARCFIDHPDGVAARAQRREPPLDFPDLRGVDGEAQFIIVAGAKRELRTPRLAEGGGEAVGDVDHRMREPAQGPAFMNARRGAMQARGEIVVLRRHRRQSLAPTPQGEAGVADMAAHIDDVAWTGAAPQPSANAASQASS